MPWHSFPYFPPQQLLKSLEEESRTAAQKPRVMKKFSETQKAERVLSNTRSTKKQPTLTETSSDGEEGEGETGLPSAEGQENEGEAVNASPRNKTLLSKLGTRLRGGGGRGKKTTSSTTTSKKIKE